MAKAKAKKTKVKPVTVPASAGKKWWQFPDSLWQKVPSLQQTRMRAALESHILPLLQELEALYPGRYEPYTIGKTLQEIEEDPRAIEGGLYLYELAQQEGLVKFERKKGAKRGPKAPVGSCGMSVGDIKSHYLRTAAHMLLKNAGHKMKRLTEYFNEHELQQVKHLAGLTILVRFDPLSISELQVGLKGRLDKLLAKDELYLETLRECKPVMFLRALRKSLGDEFPAILEWKPDFLRAVAEGLDHSAKITALGQMLLFIDDPDIVRALGTWQIKEVVAENQAGEKKKRYITRIGQIKALLGEDFDKLLHGNARLVEKVGSWKDEEVDQIKFYLGFITPEVMETLEPLPFKLQLGILDGLWDTQGRRFMEQAINKENLGIKAIRGIVGQINEAIANDNMPNDVRALIKSGFYSKHTAHLSKAM